MRIATRFFFPFALTAEEADWMRPGIKRVSEQVGGKAFYVNSVTPSAVFSNCTIMVWNLNTPNTVNEQFWGWFSGPSPPPPP